MTKELKICMTGFGNVGRRFCRLIQDKSQEILDDYGYKIILTGICTRSKGLLVNPRGLDIDEIFEMNERNQKFDSKSPYYLLGDAFEMIEKSKADVFIELSTLSINDGQPATSYIENAFSKNMHVITANKGPEAWHYKRLMEIANRKKLHYLFETIVMDGTPVFNFVKYTLPGVKINGIRGILNGTSNFVLCQLEKGMTYDEAIKEAQRIELAEADPSMDIDGWDGAAKICSLANILMDAGLNPKDVEVESIAGITKEDILEAKSEGYKIKYICEAKKDKGTKNINISVGPQKISMNDEYCNVEDTSAAITFYTDLAGEMTIIQTDPNILQTAYGVYSDLLTLIKSI
jgi:homoserine dehydrogenase